MNLRPSSQKELSGTPIFYRHESRGEASKICTKMYRCVTSQTLQLRKILNCTCGAMPNSNVDQQCRQVSKRPRRCCTASSQIRPGQVRSREVWSSSKQVNSCWIRSCRLLAPSYEYDIFFASWKITLLDKFFQAKLFDFGEMHGGVFERTHGDVHTRTCVACKLDDLGACELRFPEMLVQLVV